ncbi:hypothetical protein BYZ73_13340 [Rhodovulum viride]|uniref:Mannose-6-phosphate isomerase type 3 n=1 Tax=Rhodovulum viride TaxID=1231134 RepID=A0ABX9DGL8_9RHOB|nr:AGE family epimerase/isomerase [Rhodovulum viride]RAP40751.1 hypothetical protein BYZ73_13340 [Rhodovulum viride]
MTDLSETTVAFRLWLEVEVLPVQAALVRDEAGFCERLSPEGDPVDLPRRAMVAARQLFAFSRLMGAGLGGAWPELLANHARDVLLAEHLAPDGAVLPIAGGGSVFSLYDVAFCLFALAAAPEAVLPRARAEALADRILTRLDTLYRHPEAGFEEARPRRLPLRANPHMHLLEACLEWIDSGPCDPRFQALADEIAELCLARFIDPGTGAQRELFDGDWRIAAGPGNAVEPGHQYEWGWLLLRWGVLRDNALAQAAGRRLIDLAEAHGLTADGLAASLLTPALAIDDATARLWPQTERIKAWALRARLGTGPADATLAEAKAVEACQGLMRFFVHPLRGSWWENLAPGGAPRSEPARTSSLYHIVGAYHELATLAAHLSQPIAMEQSRTPSTA